MTIQDPLEMLFETILCYNNGFARIIRQIYPIINFEILSNDLQ